VALTVRNAGRVDLYGFATNSFRHDVKVGASALRETERFVQRCNTVGYGTNIIGALRQGYQPGVHKRVFIISDMQTMDSRDSYNVNTVVPSDVPVYAFNLGGYQPTLMETGRGNRHEIGGLGNDSLQRIAQLQYNLSLGAALKNPDNSLQRVGHIR